MSKRGGGGGGGGGGMWSALPLPANAPSDASLAARIAACADWTPTTPEEYLAYVRYQAKRIPDVMETSAVDVRAFDANVSVFSSAQEQAAYAASVGASSSAHAALPALPAAWEARTLANFHAARAALERAERAIERGTAPRPPPVCTLPSSADVKDWLLACLGWQDVGAGPVRVCAPGGALALPITGAKRAPAVVAAGGRMETSEAKRPRLEPSAAGDVAETVAAAAGSALPAADPPRDVPAAACAPPLLLPASSVLLALDQYQACRALRRFVGWFSRRHEHLLLLAGIDALLPPPPPAQPFAADAAAAPAGNAAADASFSTLLELRASTQIRGTLASMGGAASVRTQPTVPASAAATAAADIAGEDGALAPTLERLLDGGYLITPAAAAWLYALLARLESPLLADTAAVLRQLFLLCRRQRLWLAAAARNRPTEHEAAAPPTLLAELAQSARDARVDATRAGLDTLFLITGTAFAQRLQGE